MRSISSISNPSWTRSHAQSMRCIARIKVHPTTSAANSPPTLTPHPKTQTQTKTTPSSPYPFDYLVFVRNVRTGTNKTMLKPLFAQAFQDQDGGGKDTEGHIRPRPSVSITSTLSRAWTRCVFDPYLPICLLISPFAGLKADPYCMPVLPSSRGAANRLL